MKVEKQEADVFGSEMVMQDECYTCQEPIDGSGWYSAMILPAGQITIIQCEECAGMKDAGPPKETP